VKTRGATKKKVVTPERTEGGNDRELWVETWVIGVNLDSCGEGIGVRGTLSAYCGKEEAGSTRWVTMIREARGRERRRPVSNRPSLRDEKGTPDCEKSCGLLVQNVVGGSTFWKTWAKKGRGGKKWLKR